MSHLTDDVVQTLTRKGDSCFLDRLRQLDQAATPGTWESDPDFAIGEYPSSDLQRVLRSRDGGEVCIYQGADSADAELIAAMRNVLPALLDVAEAVDRHANSPNVPHSAEWDDELEDVYALVDRLLVGVRPAGASTERAGEVEA